MNEIPTRASLLPHGSPWEPSHAHSATLARNWWVMALRGIGAILFGLVAFGMPGLVLLTLVFVFAAYLVFDGVLAIVAGIRAASHHERFRMLLLEGVLNIVTGLVVGLFPFGAVLALVLLTAAWAIVTGGVMLAGGLRLHHTHGRLWLLAGGGLSVIWGALLLVAPLLGAVVLAWWLGFYAVLFGITLLVLAFRLRPHRTA